MLSYHRSLGFIVAAFVLFGPAWFCLSRPSQIPVILPPADFRQLFSFPRYWHKSKTLPEAQRTQGIDSLTWVISPAKYNATCIGSKFGQLYVVPLVLVQNLTTRWCHQNWFQIWPTDGAICISCIIVHNLHCRFIPICAMLVIIMVILSFPLESLSNCSYTHQITIFNNLNLNLS